MAYNPSLGWYNYATKTEWKISVDPTQISYYNSYAGRWMVGKGWDEAPFSQYVSYNKGDIVTDNLVLYCVYDTGIPPEPPSTEYSLMVWVTKKGQAAGSFSQYFTGSVSTYTLPTAEKLEADGFIAPTAFFNMATYERYELGSTITLTKDVVILADYGDLYSINYYGKEIGSNEGSYIFLCQQLSYKVNLDASRYSYTGLDGKFYQGYKWNTKIDGSGTDYMMGDSLNETEKQVNLFCIYEESEKKVPIIYRLNFNLSSVSFSGSLQIMLLQNEMTIFSATHDISAAANTIDFETTETNLNNYVVRVFASSNSRLAVADNGVVSFDYVGIDQDGRYRIYAATVPLIETDVFMVGNRTYTNVTDAINAANGGVINAYATGVIDLGSSINYAIRINDVLGAGYTITAVSGCDIDITGAYRYVQGRVHLEKGGVYKFAEDYNAGTKNIAYTTSSTDQYATVTIIIKGVSYSYLIKDLVA